MHNPDLMLSILCARAHVHLESCMIPMEEEEEEEEEEAGLLLTMARRGMAQDSSKNGGRGSSRSRGGDATDDGGRGRGRLLPLLLNCSWDGGHEFPSNWGAAAVAVDFFLNHPKRFL